MNVIEKNVSWYLTELGIDFFYLRISWDVPNTSFWTFFWAYVELNFYMSLVSNILGYIDWVSKRKSSNYMVQYLESLYKLTALANYSIQRTLLKGVQQLFYRQYSYRWEKYPAIRWAMATGPYLNSVVRISFYVGRSRSSDQTQGSDLGSRGQFPTERLNKPVCPCG